MHVTLDILLDIIILCNLHKYKAMQFPNSIEGWQSHSGNMPLKPFRFGVQLLL
jgi:hypothetical protein